MGTAQGVWCGHNHGTKVAIDATARRTTTAGAKAKSMRTRRCKYCPLLDHRLLAHTRAHTSKHMTSSNDIVLFVDEVHLRMQTERVALRSSSRFQCGCWFPRSSPLSPSRHARVRPPRRPRGQRAVLRRCGRVCHALVRRLLGAARGPVGPRPQPEACTQACRR